jgi:hypothetical protein
MGNDPSQKAILPSGETAAIIPNHRKTDNRHRSLLIVASQRPPQRRSSWIAPAPERGKGTPWKEFIRTHLEVLAAMDFFMAEVWTARGLMTYYVLVFPRVGARRLYRRCDALAGP